MTPAQPLIDRPVTAATPTSPAELRKPRRRASWPAVVAITAAAIGAGTLLGMRLRETNSDAQPPMAASGAMPGMAEAAPARPPGAGSQATYVSPRRQQLVGVRTAVVGMQKVENTIRTVGMLAYDETRTTQIHTRVSGWVEQLYVDYVGKSVRRGQPLFAVYSPDLATAQGEYLVALHARAQVTGGADTLAAADALLAASRERLRRWDVSDAQIAELEHAGHAARTMTIASPFDGVVLEKSAFAGQYVTPDMTSFRLGDLSTVWVMGQVFEYEAGSLRIGDSIDVEFPYDQAAKLQARIDFIYPEVDPQTRRVRFRASLKNTDLKLKPDTYVTLVWHGETTKRLVVPKEAVIDTGARKYVLLALADGYFEPRDVQVGSPIGEFYPVIGGVTDGARVVTSAQFLIDSETNLMAAMQGMSLTMPGMAAGSASAP
ncbi:MAG: efflux RND transporter periplasmic adaptor subunit [Deltaproteobacteria bacterium]